MPDQPFLCKAFVSSKVPSSLKGKGMRSQDVLLFRPLLRWWRGFGTPPPARPPALARFLSPPHSGPELRFSARHGLVVSRPGDGRHRMHLCGFLYTLKSDIVSCTSPTQAAPETVSQNLEPQRSWRTCGVSSLSRVPEGKMQAMQKPHDLP